MYPLILWYEILRYPLDAYRSWRKWTPTRKAANGYGLSWDKFNGRVF